MRKRKQEKREEAETAEAADELLSALGEIEQEAAERGQEGIARGAEGDEAEVETATEGDVLVESPEETIERLTKALDEQQDRYLRLAAEFDNFRKRTVRERGEISIRAKADLVAGILDGLDDLDRVSQLDPGTTTAKDIIDGVELVERKLFRELEMAGLVRVGIEGAPFDPNYHEAVAATPAPEADKDNLVAAVLQVGYRMGDQLLRPARVQVFLTPQPDEDTEA